MKKKLFIFAAALLVIIMLAASTTVFADFGGFSGDTDYGGSSDSGSSGWDWSGSDSGSSDWGFDGGTGGISLLPAAGCTGGGIMFIMVIVFIIVLIAILRSKAQQQQQQQNTAQPSVTIGVKPTEASELDPIDSYIAEHDPGFSVSDMEGKLSNLYVQMQDSWCKKDISSLRPYLTDELYSKSDRQLDEIRRAGQTPHIERIAVLGVNIRGWFERDGKDHLIAELNTRITTYSTSDMTGEVVKGNRNIEKFMTYEWELTRTSGVLTQPEEELKTVTCPNCGAPVSINKSAQCPYCDTVITLDEHDWVLSSIKGLSQKSVG